MSRLYKFLLFLFLLLFGISFIYGTAISWCTLKLLQATAGNGIQIGYLPVSAFFLYGFVQALTYSLVLLLFTIFLIKRSIRRGQKLTVRKIIATILWFFLVTTIVFVIHYTLFPNDRGITYLLLTTGPQFFLSGFLWFPFPIAWLTLFIIIGLKIKKTA